MWEDRSALCDLDLAHRNRILEVGCGTGSFTQVLAEESPARLLAVDADLSLLQHVTAGDRLGGDTFRLPVKRNAVDLVVCQALLINLRNPVRALTEFVRVSTDRIAVIEPDNSAVEIDSTVRNEPTITRRLRELYIDGVDTDVTLGASTESLFESVGITPLSTRKYVHQRQVAPPYDPDELDGAIRKAKGTRLVNHQETLLNSGVSPSEFDRLRSKWRTMGRTAIEQMQTNDYHREETIPFYVTVGRIPTEAESRLDDY